MFQEMVMINFMPLLAIVFLFSFVYPNSMFENKVLNLFKKSVIICLIAVVVYSLELWTASWDSPSNWRILFSAIGYTTRPLIVMCIIYIVNRNDKKYSIIFFVPAIFNTIIAFSGFFSDISFSYDETNEFVRGPLGFTTHVVTFLYFVVLFVIACRIYKENRVQEVLVIFIIMLSNALATVFETGFKIHGMLSASIVLSITFYYLHINSENFKRDALTGVFNRRCFFVDCEKMDGKIASIVSVDLNDLKVINDTYGHQKGDEAINSMVSCAKKAMTRGMRLYRTGGDEFMMIITGVSREKVNEMIEAFKKNMSQTQYSCAIGVAFWEDKDNLTDVIARADVSMYDDKANIKKTLVR